MILDCDIKNPLVRDGTSQNQRILPPLNPDYARVDDRTLADLLCLADRYSRQLQYYDLNNKPDGEWQAFIQNDIAATIALLSKKDVGAFKNCLEEISLIITNSTVLDDTLRCACQALFDMIFTLAREIDDWYGRATDGLKLKSELTRIITARLKAQLFRAIGCYKCAKTNAFTLACNSIVVPACHEICQNSETILTTPFRSPWIIQEAAAVITWDSYIAGIVPDCSAFGDETDPDHERIKTALGRIVPVFEEFYNAQKQIIFQAPMFLAETLTNWPRHEPHMALFLTFLQLFQYAQQHLNTISQRHLDFYYQEVLQFKPKKETPDRVHLIFELAKQVNSHLVKKGTRIKAGKDATGVEVVYQTDRDIVVNRAQIAQLKTVHLDYNDRSRIYAAPVANSADGQGKAFATGEPKWKTFGESQRISGTFRSPGERNMEFPQIGFAIAAPILFLQEGTRTIKLHFDMSETGLAQIPGTEPSLQTVQVLPNQIFNIRLSGEKAWINIKTENIQSGAGFSTVTLKLTPEDPPVVGYISEVLGGCYPTQLPVLEFLLTNQPSQPYNYELLKKLVLSKIDIKVEVRGVKNLLLQTDVGPVAASKPFYPFGTVPGINSSFYIGSKEIFQKKLTLLKLKLEWKDVPAINLGSYYENLASYQITGQTLVGLQAAGVPGEVVSLLEEAKEQYVLGKGKAYDVYKAAVGDDNVFNMYKQYFFQYAQTPESTINNSDFKAQGKILINNSWQNLGGLKSIFNTSDATRAGEIAFEAEFNNLENYSARGIARDLTEYKNDSSHGFIKLELKAPAMAFGHQIFRDVYTRRIIAYANDPTNANLEASIPNEPYTPLVNSMTVDYDAIETIDLQNVNDFQNRRANFFHIYPFGHKEVHKKLESPSYLLPGFQFKENGITRQSEGELYLGIAGLQPGQNLSILFQVAEGSVNPELPKQMLYWSYLGNNQWQPFNYDEILFDSTNGLLTSGIIAFAIPTSANSDNTLLPEGLHWLRACVNENSAAICDMIDIQAQAIQASFVNQGNDPNFLAENLPAGSVGKLLIKEAAIKSITQPYASSGGKVQEQPRQYYTRVSERLRHKGRGISVWDYEKLVLEQFPGIYKVKCINHSTFNLITENYSIRRSEFAPGFVTIIVIPNLRNKNAVDPLEPRANLNTLEQIKAYLSKLISPFAAKNLRVINPLYEKIQLEFSVAFHPGFDRGFYEKKLNEDIKRYLSPWAFEEGHDIVFGGKIYQSVILNFIEERPYVDFVAEFKMNQIIADGTFTSLKNNVDEAIPSTARSILVSDNNHKIKEVKSCP